MAAIAFHAVATAGYNYFAFVATESAPKLPLFLFSLLGSVRFSRTGLGEH